MSQVWKATDRKSGRIVCLKILDKVKTEALLKRFVGKKRPDEGVVAMSLDHPNVVKTYEHGLTTKDEQYLVMEFVDGYGMNFLVETRKIVGKEFPILLGTAAGIGHFHEKGYIHRDICPRNVMVTYDDVPKLIDFGLAVPNTAEFRAPGNRTGTANYMAPELIRRSTTDQRIDVFSFGVTCFEVFTGTLPWENAQSLEAVLSHINTPPRDPREFRPEMPDRLANFLLRSIATDPNDRHTTMAAVIADLESLQEQYGHDLTPAGP